MERVMSKGRSLLFVLIAYRLDLALGVNYIRTAVIIGFIINELISITENAGIMGVPIPGVITKAIDCLNSDRRVIHMIKICLDAGHYGKYNQSPANKKYYRSEAMFKLVEHLREELLTYKDVHVKTTRANIEDNPSLYSRGKKAKGYDLFISEHSNAVGSRIDNNVDYAVVYRSYKNKNNADDLGLKLANAVANVMGTKQNPPTSTRKSEKKENGNITVY